VDWVYGADVADGLLAAATAAGVEGRTVDLGSGTLVPIREVVEQLVELIDPTLRPEMAAASDRPLEPVRVGRADEAAAAIGWRASTPLAEGLARTVAWYRQQPSR
jgi:nucleoside-diphosphate-sugar epimerase